MTRRQQVQVGLIAVLAGFPLMPAAGGVLGNGAKAAVFAIIAASLVLLTGWVGQISLGHAAFVGIGAYATGWAAGALGLIFPLTLPVAAIVAGGAAAILGVIALRVRGLYLAVATLIFSWAASEYLFRQSWVLDHSSVPPQAIGDPQGLLYIDLGSRFVFYYIAWAIAIAILYGLVNLRDSKSGRAFAAVRGSEMAAASLGMNVLHYKTLAFALSGAIAGVAGNLMMSHSQVVSPDSFDFNGSLFFLAIAVVGGLTSLAGGVAAALIFATMDELFFRIAVLNQFLQLVSAALLAIIFRAYPGGLAVLGRSLGEWIIRVAQETREWPSRIEERIAAFAKTPTTGIDGTHDTEDVDNSSGSEGIGLPTVVVRFIKRATHGMRAMAAGITRSVLGAITRGPSGSSSPREPLDLDAPRAGLEHTELIGAEAGSISPNGRRQGQVRSPSDGAAETRSARLEVQVRSLHSAPYDAAHRHERPALIHAEHITMRFGGLIAVNDASMTVREGEITGLIGPNGAGKTTLFNTIAGFLTPTEGRIHLYGEDVTGMPVHRRAQFGVGRTFQLLQLFGNASVFENLLAATHLQNTTGFVQHMAVTPRALYAEAQARARVSRVIELLELEDVADRRVAGLPFGLLRMVEVARAVVMGARVVMLDEPASGLDERETDRLMEVLEFVRRLGATLLLIEHDVRMVTAVTDYMYVLDQGRMIAEGTPTEIQRNPDVVAAYLGAATPSAMGVR